jgi:hypothetical protein
MSSLGSFALFPTFQMELRLDIWRKAFPAHRKIKSLSFSIFNEQGQNPVALTVNRESRAEALKTLLDQSHLQACKARSWDHQYVGLNVDRCKYDPYDFHYHGAATDAIYYFPKSKPLLRRGFASIQEIRKVGHINWGCISQKKRQYAVGSRIVFYYSRVESIEMTFLA